jgi:hypothetical protein
MGQWDPGSPAHGSPMACCLLSSVTLQVLTSAGWAEQLVVDSTEDSRREWLVRVEWGAGHPESQLVRPSEEREPRPPPITWAARCELGGQIPSQLPMPASTPLPPFVPLLRTSPLWAPETLGSSQGWAAVGGHPYKRLCGGRKASGCSPRSWHTPHGWC